MKKLYFRTNGYIIEFFKLDRYLVFYSIKKILSFLVDIIIYICFMTILIFVLNVSLIASFLYSYLIFVFWMTFQLFIFKNKTTGMLLAGLVIGSYDGYQMPTNKILIRGLLMSLYAVPILGVVLMITSLFSTFMSKGITWVDICSKTQVFSNEFYKNINYIYKNIQEG